MEKKQDLRMYFFVMGNLSGRQQGIQAGHAALEYSNKMIQLLAKLWGFGVKFSEFYEPDLNNSLSAIAFIVPENIYNFDFDNYVLDKNYLETSGEKDFAFNTFLKRFRLASN